MSLSVIVPILNEGDHLPRLFSTLGSQQGCEFELILIDGGSTDGSLEMAERLASDAPFACHIVNSERGRGRQLNKGRALSTGRTLLFLHADSQFLEEDSLTRALNCLDDSIADAGHERFAGHFALRFDGQGTDHSFGFYFLESKAQLDRPGCIHGDQGYLIRRNFFDQVGPFQESLGFLEDNRLAQAVRQQGRWLLLPPVVLTSSRRFHQEGFRQRQLLNALIMGLEAVGRDDLLTLFPDIYRQQSRTRQLDSRPFFQHLATCLAAQSRPERRRFWYRIGRYLVANAWQLAFCCDVRRAFRRGLEPGTGPAPVLKFYDRYVFWVLNHRLGHSAAALLARIWFVCQFTGR